MLGEHPSQKIRDVGISFYHGLSLFDVQGQNITSLCLGMVSIYLCFSICLTSLFLCLCKIIFCLDF